VEDGEIGYLELLVARSNEGGETIYERI